MLIHDLERPGGDFPVAGTRIGEAKRLRIEGERLFRPSPPSALPRRNPSDSESKQPSRFVAALDALQGEEPRALSALRAQPRSAPSTARPTGA